MANLFIYWDIVEFNVLATFYLKRAKWYLGPRSKINDHRNIILEEGFAVYWAETRRTGRDYREREKERENMYISITCIYIRDDRFTREIVATRATLSKPPDVISLLEGKSFGTFRWIDWNVRSNDWQWIPGLCSKCTIRIIKPITRVTQECLSH